MGISISITAKNILTTKEWESVWARSENATFFQSPTWHKLWSEYNDGKLGYGCFEYLFSDGKSVMLPFTRISMAKGYLNKLVCSPAGTYGGIFSLSDIESDHLQLVSNEIKRLSIELVDNPFLPFLEQSGNTIITSLIEIDDSFEALVKRWSKGHKATINQARKNGIKIEISENLEDWEKYFELYQKSIRRWGDSVTSNYSWNLFRFLYKHRDSVIRLWVGRYQGAIIAGGIFFYSNKHVVYWHGVADNDHFDKRPVHLMIYEALKQAVDRGYRWFDFNPSGKLEGVRKFKKGFGCKEIAVGKVSHESILMKTFNFLR